MVVLMHIMRAMEQELLTSAEVCERLDINRSTLTRWVAAGRIAAATKMPGLRGGFLFELSEVERVEAGSAA